MINKIKNMSRLSERIDELNQKVDHNTDAVKEISRSIEDLKEKVNCIGEDINDSFSRIVSKHENFKDSFKNNIESINETNIRFSKIINEFSLMKSNLTEKVFDEIRKNIKPYMERIKNDSTQFDRLSLKIDNLNSDINLLSEEIKKFKEISVDIKKSDFNLIKYQKKLESEDHRKLIMMREIEKLKRMVGKERRRNTR